jgi:hypothetical protein
MATTPRPLKGHTRIHLATSSMQNTDRPAEIERDVAELFLPASWRRGWGLPHAIVTTESERRGPVGPLLEEYADRHGWGYSDVRGDVQILTRPDVEILEPAAYVHVLDGRGGMPRGNYPDRGVVEELVGISGERVWVHGIHPNTGYVLDDDPGQETRREEGIAKVVTVGAERTRAHGRGTVLSFLLGDLNVDEAKDRGQDRDAPHAILRRHGLVSGYDDAGRYPDTHGHATYDVALRSVHDGRVRFVNLNVYAPRRSDHRRASFLYDVAPLRLPR